jgi:NADH dehydrogenase
MPFLPLIGGGHTKFQPVFVGDVAEAVAKAVDGALQAGGTYELGGPEVKTFRELMQITLKIANRKRVLLPLPFPLARLQAGVFELIDSVSFGLLMPSALRLTRDQVTLLQRDNVVSDKAEKDGLTLEGMGVEGETIEAIVPSYLYRFRKAGQFERMADA